MNIYHIREFWFDDFYDGGGAIQRAFLTAAEHSRDGAIEGLLEQFQYASTAAIRSVFNETLGSSDVPPSAV